jgi:glutathione S-transferase
MTMKLYFMPGTCSLSPNIVAHELGLPVEMLQIDRKNKLTPAGQDYKTINPKGSVPALEMENGQVLTEGAAIVQYLADLKPESKLAPAAGTLERYRLQEWLNYIASEVHKSYSPLFNPRNPDDVKAAAREHLGTRFSFLEKHFDTNEFLMGSAFSVADAYLFTVLRWAAAVHVDLASWPKLKAFFDRIAARPAVIAAMTQEKLIK